jgi:large subunit ribosomal protein L7/L12
MPEITKEDFFKHLDKLTVLELVEYIKEFEERYGIEAAAAMPVGMMPAAGGQAAQEEAEEKTEFDVIIAEVGPKKINVIKAVREVTSLGLKEAKALVDEAPGSKVAEGVSKEDAEKIKAKFEEVGAKVEIK